MSLKFEELQLNFQNFAFADACFHISGDDAASYLNSQTTNNIDNLKIGSFQENALLDISGKIISYFILCRHSESEFYLLTKKEYAAETFTRVEKFHISEDFEIQESNLHFSLSINFESKDLGEGYLGTFFGADAFIHSKKLNLSKESDYLKLRVLTGQPEFGTEVKSGELINNTRLDELCVDYKKGCYPGQETVSKIDSRRGAAYKPVLLKVNAENLNKDFIFEGKVLKEGKKIGEILSFFKQDEEYFLYASLNRENRVEASQLDFKMDGVDFLFHGEIFYYPYLKITKETIAVEVYDLAMDYFLAEDNTNAVHYFKLAIDLNPKFEDAYESLGVLYGRLEKYDLAIELMESLRSLNENALMAYTNLSLYHMKIGNIETAEKFKSEATLLNFKTLGTAAQRKREEEEVLKRRLLEMEKREGMFLQVLEIDVEDAMANNGMGEIEFERENFDSSVKYFQAAILADKKYSVAYLGQAKALYQLEKWSECRQVLEAGILIASKNGDLMPANQMQTYLLKIKQ